MSLTKSSSVGAQVSNGWNDVINNTGRYTLGLSTTYTQKLFSWSEAYLNGDEPQLSANPLAPGVKSRRQLIDNILKLTPTSTQRLYRDDLWLPERCVTRRRQMVWSRRSRPDSTLFSLECKLALGVL